MKARFAAAGFDWDQFVEDVGAVLTFAGAYPYATYAQFWLERGCRPEIAQALADTAADYFPVSVAVGAS